MTTKKEVKKDINRNGFFVNMPMTRKNAPEEWAGQIPAGAIYFEGVASNGDINRNGYIIRESAWKNAIAGYLINPVVLLQHDMDEPVGNALWAKVTPNGLEVGGYVFDELTANRFSKGLFRALSTGHYTLAAEFENEETGEVMSEEDFIAAYNPARSFWDNEIIPPKGWILAVTELEWAEFSIVSIGSNRRSLVSHQNAISNYFRKKLMNNEEQEIPTEPVAVPTETPVTPPEITPENVTPEDTPEGSEKEEETPPTVPVETEAVPVEPPAEPAEGGAEKAEPEVNGLRLSVWEKAYKDMHNANAEMKNRITELEKLNAELEEKLNTPARRGASTLGAAKAEPVLAGILRNKGIPFNS